MKKFIIPIAVMAGLCLSFFVRNAHAVSQPQSLGNVAIQLPNLTAAQVLASTASYKGQPIYCSDCLANGGLGTICVSTASAASNQYVLSTGTTCK